jgi:2'-5' RNA ligase
VVDAGGAGLVELLRVVAAFLSPRTALVVPVPEAEPLIGPWRETHTRDGAAGMGAHVTLIVPFAPVDELDTGELHELFGAVEPFAYTLERVGEWPEDGVVYLDPRPAERFLHLTRLLVERYPDHRPYGGLFEVDELVPHATVVQTDDASARADAAASVAPSLPISCNAHEVWLVHEVNGRWQRHTSFRLGR